MNAFRKEYSLKSSVLYGDIKTGTMNANDAYFMNTQSTYEWVSVVKPLLEAYFNTSRAEGTKNAIRGKLAEGLKTLAANQAKLGESLHSLDPLTNRKNELRSHFNVQFDANRRSLLVELKELLAKGKEEPLDRLEKDLLQQLKGKMEGIKQYGIDLTYRMDEVARDIKSIETKLQNEIETIENLIEKIEPLKGILDSDAEAESDKKFDDYLTAYAPDLIAACEEYRQRHKKNQI